MKSSLWVVVLLQTHGNHITTQQIAFVSVCFAGVGSQVMG